MFVLVLGIFLPPLEAGRGEENAKKGCEFSIKLNTWIEN